MLELTLRLVFSLAVVLGLMLVLVRIGARRGRGRHGDLVRVLHRAPLTRGTSVAVVAVGTRVLVLGTSEQQVRVLTELDPDEVAEAADAVPAVPEPTTLAPTTAATALPPQPARGAHRADVPAAARSARAAEGALAGSVLSVDTWRQALAAATRRAS